MGAPEHITDHDVIEALAALPDITAAEVAGALGVGRSTAAKRLARLEAEGVVRRAPGGRSSGVKVADHWSLATPPVVADPDVAHPGGGSAPTAPGTTATGDLATTGSEPKSAQPATGDPDGDDPDGNDRGGNDMRGAEEAGAEGSGGEGSRLAPGSLRGLVRDYLADRPGQSFGPSGVAKSLGRSAGAVSNALSAMAESGEVRLVGEGPRRYRIARRD
jgi:DNA-binding transcriptional MocR family regulator